MSGWGWFILVVILLVPAAYFGYIYYLRLRASKQGLPAPSFNPFANRHEHGGSQIYPAPAGIIGWLKNKYYGLRNSRSQAGAYEQTGDSGRRGHGGAEDEAWDSRVGDDGYGTGGYYEEQELGLQPPPAQQGGQQQYGGRGRSVHREAGEEDTAYHPQGVSRNRGRGDNPFGDGAEESSMRAVSPRPERLQTGGGAAAAGGGRSGHQKGRSDVSDVSGLGADDSPTERRSMFREDVR